MADFLKEFGLILGATLVAMVLFLVATAILGVFERRKQLKARRRKSQDLNRMLDGRSLEEALEASDYDFAHFQGEDGYRIFKKGTERECLEFANSALDAHLRIVERARREGNRTPPGPAGETRCH